MSFVYTGLFSCFSKLNCDFKLVLIQVKDSVKINMLNKVLMAI
mgnify:CR=1 FL=1